MTDLCVSGVDLSEYIWNDTHVHDMSVIRIDRAVVSLYPKVHLSVGGPGDTSGIQWTFFVKKDGSRTDHDDDSFVMSEDEQWKIALSYRGPFITALSYQAEHQPGDRPGLITMVADKSTSPALVAMTKKLAEELRLTYLDAHELMALEIPWEELQGNASNRLDYAEMPNAFNLLFFE